MRIFHGFLLGLHLFVGFGALVGGLAAILDPTAPLGASTDMLANSPFDTFLIPGILLFGVLGLGNLAAAGCLRFRRLWQGYVSGVAGGALMVWIAVQCVMLQAVVFLHVLFFVLGAIIGCLALALLAREKLWPGAWAERFLSRTAGKRKRG